jgi:hypothetical protein
MDVDLSCCCREEFAVLISALSRHSGRRSALAGSGVFLATFLAHLFWRILARTTAIAYRWQILYVNTPFWGSWLKNLGGELWPIKD